MTTLCIIMAIVVILLLVLIRCMPTRKEYFSTSPKCTGLFPPPPTTMPPSAYGQLVTPKIISSAYNKDKTSTMNKNADSWENMYDSSFLCNTPADMFAVNSDSCAQY